MLNYFFLITLFLFSFTANLNQVLADNFFKSKFASYSRNNVSVVGSSTLYPFISIVAETFGRETKYRTPIIEATGTGGGFKLFCSGVGYDYPDIVNASRAIKNSEVEKCQQKQINFGEIKIGYDGIVLANSVKGVKFFLTKEQIFLALAENIFDKNDNLVKNFYQNWNEIDNKLPKLPIKIYGPPSTSGTRDAFVELVMIDYCAKQKNFQNKYQNSEILHKKCQIIRSDGVFVEAGENDNLIVQKLKNDENALGIFGFSFLQENASKIQPANIDDIAPNFDNIALGKYRVSRPLFVYYKIEHLNLIAGFKEFLTEIANKNTISSNGYLMQAGLIPPSNQEIEKNEVELRKNL
ncbi:MAG: substrate-binding domain-containing protein [Alphaproteobacteria bacterium]